VIRTECEPRGAPDFVEAPYGLGDHWPNMTGDRGETRPGWTQIVVPADMSAASERGD